MVKHQQNGYLAEYRSSESFADGMEWVINHPNRAELDEAARQTIMDHFSEEVIAKKHIEVYNKLLRQPTETGGAHVSA
jgi:glycosyltransferase involved in cell wall biosynthesis